MRRSQTSYYIFAALAFRTIATAGLLSSDLGLEIGILWNDSWAMALALQWLMQLVYQSTLADAEYHHDR